MATAGSIYGGQGSVGAISFNTVTIQGSGTVSHNSGSVNGGEATGGGSVTDNTVYIGENSSGNGAYTGTIQSKVYGGSSLAPGASGDALRNRVIMSSGTVSGDIYGGATNTGNANNNTVAISGGTVSGDIYGGYVNDTGSGSAINNIVSISTSGATYNTIYGGWTGSSTGDLFTGNTLNLHTSSMTAANVYNFEKLNFYLPSTLTASTTPLLTVTGTANLTNGAGNNTGSRSSIVNVGIDGASSPLQVGEQFVLIDAGTLVTNGLNSTANGQGMQGVTLKYEFDLVIDGQKLLAKFSKVGINEQTKALSEGWLSGLALVTQGADLIAGRGIAEAVNAARVARESVSTGLAAFGTLSGGWSRYNTGSHVEMSSLSVLAGLSYGADLTPGHLTLGGFFEYGNGSYDTY
ncbi:MAG: hypothetical protein LBP75_10550, partial [Planctomycetota bacterium]|nr:hypothetical protein [Planctomycetota bacterium]